jgi:cell division septation protein DedD
LGDVYFIQGDFAKAENCYAELLDTKLKPAVLFRLSEIYQKKGDDAKSKEYLAKLKDEYPASLEAKVNKGLSVMLQRPPAEESSVSEERSSFEEAAGTKVYSVQVGFFSSKENALNFKEKLAKKDFPAYVEEVEAEGKLSYRVKVGKLGSLREALELQKQLSQAGYPTKVCP